MPAITNLTGTGYLFPLQSGNSGKYLTTDGSALSWGTPSGGGGLSGSGTTNYISKWTSGSALGNSLVYDSGTNVGIGTATPSYKLDVSGIISASVDATYNGENGAIIAGNATTPTKRVFIGYDGTNDVGFIQSLHSGVGYKNLVLNPTLGYVGIGTITPTHRLEVNGDALVNGTFTITASTALPVQTAANLRFASGFSSPDIGRMYIGDGTGWKFHMAKRISSTTTDLITFQDNGNVGIGTATPGHLLEVNGDAMVSGTTELMTYTGVGINADSSTMLYVQGSGNTAEDFSAVFQNSDFDNLMKIHNNGKINMGFLPTSATGLSTGDLWNDSGTLKIV